MLLGASFAPLRLCGRNFTTFSVTPLHLFALCRTSKPSDFRPISAKARHLPNSRQRHRVHALKSARGDTEERITENDEPTHTEIFNFRCGDPGSLLARRSSCPVGRTLPPGSLSADNRGYGRYDDRGLRDSVHRLDRLAKDFERDMDRALDHSRANGSRREDQINNQVHQFRDAVGDLKSRVGNGRDLNRSSNEARRVLQEADDFDRFGGAVDSMAAPLQSGRRSNRSFATSATSTVLVMAVVMAAMTTGVATTATTATTTTTATTIGGDEFHSLGTNPHLTSACNLLVYPAKGLGSRRRGLYLCQCCNPVK